MSVGRVHRALLAYQRSVLRKIHALHSIRFGFYPWSSRRENDNDVHTARRFLSLSERADRKAECRAYDDDISFRSRNRSLDR